MAPEDLERWYVRSSTGTMAPFSSFIGHGSGSRDRRGSNAYNGRPALNIQGQGAPGVSSGTAMDEMERLVAELPKGFGLEWTGASFQERLSGAQAPALYAISLLVSCSSVSRRSTKAGAFR